jgi:Rrf2 family iron-sulfur cluster assembly transcriptional regulator
MMLSTRGRYAVMAMVDLASCASGKPVSLAEISERQEIPLAYLEQIFAKLRKSGLVKSVRGPGGGYQLLRPAAETWVSDIIMAAEEPIKMTRCDSGPSGCMKPKTRCLTHDLWEGLGNQIYNYLRSVSLEDICDKRLRQKFTASGPSIVLAEMSETLL